MASNIIETIKNQSKNLPVSDKVELIRFLTESLSLRTAAKPLEYGKYNNSGRSLSSLDDFEIAEWHPSEVELDGH
ncbi:MAG TPA: hypothetical protein PLK77_03210 [Pyrinomonadaceae bacterium]|jgi:hypothetical protein|nr:hypothetical protein [Pyrinomonadaceae bacterium]